MNLKVCPNCKEANVHDTPFCGSCGTKLRIDVLSICPNCQAPNLHDLLFCGACGTPLSVIENKIDTKVVASPDITVQASEAKEASQSSIKEKNADEYVIERGHLLNYSGNDIDIVIPEGVNLISKGVFKKFLTLRSVTFPSTLLVIEAEAFKECEALSSISFPDTLTNIGANAFEGCKNLSSITFGQGLKIIEKSAFLNCSAIEEIELPDSLEKIESYAFQGCKALRTITLGTGLGLLEINAFDVVDYPRDIHYRGDIAGWCNITNVHVVLEGFGPKTLYMGDGKPLYNPIVPASVKSINMAFINTTIQSVGVEAENIQYGAFFNCKQLRKVVIGNKVKYIASRILSECESLESVVIPFVTEKRSLWGTENWIDAITPLYFGRFFSTGLYNSDKSKFYTCEKEDTTYFVPKSLREITIGSMEYSIINKSDKDGSTIINKGCYESFKNFVSLRTIHFGKDCNNIPIRAFQGCTGLTSVVLPKKANIEIGAFCGCDNLKSVYVPAGIEYIRDCAFLYNDKKNINFYWEGKPDKYKGYLSDYYGFAKLDLPQNVHFIFDASAIPSDDSGFAFVMIDKVYCKQRNYTDLDDLVGTYMIAGYAGKKVELQIPSYYNDKPVTVIDHLTNKDVISVSIPKTVKRIASKAFFGSGIRRIHIPSSVIGIWSDAFAGCKSLFNIEVADDNPIYHSAGNCLIRTDANRLHIGCNLSKIPTDGSVTEIGADAFVDSNITSITIPNSVTMIDPAAFKGSALKDIYYLGTEQEWQEVTKNQQWDKYSIHFGESKPTTFINDKYVVDEFGFLYEQITEEYCTQNEYDLKLVDTYKIVDYVGTSTELIVPDSFNGRPVTVIARIENENIKSIVLSKSVKRIAAWAFYGSKLESIQISAGVVGINSSALSNCKYLTSIIVDKCNKVYRSKDNCLIRPDDYRLHIGCNTSVIPADRSVKKIAPSAFRGSGITEITIPLAVTEIGVTAFQNCSLLKTINYGGTKEQWEKIKKGSNWDKNTGYTINYNYNIPSSADSSDTDAASETKVKSKSVPGLTYDESYHYPNSYCITGYMRNEKKSLSLPDTYRNIPVTEIRLIETGNTSVQSLSIPSSVLRISCVKLPCLNTVTIPYETIKIDDGCFADCSKLKTVTIAEGNPFYHVIDNCLIEIKTKKLINGWGDCMIPSDGSVTKIAFKAFAGMSVKSIVIPDQVTELGEDAFRNCVELTIVTIPTTIKKLNSCFKGCKKPIINYKGTKADWKKVEKTYDWDSTDYGLLSYKVKVNFLGG